MARRGNLVSLRDLEDDLIQQIGRLLALGLVPAIHELARPEIASATFADAFNVYGLPNPDWFERLIRAVSPDGDESFGTYLLEADEVFALAGASHVWEGRLIHRDDGETIGISIRPTEEYIILHRD